MTIFDTYDAALDVADANMATECEGWEYKAVHLANGKGVVEVYDNEGYKVGTL